MALISTNDVSVNRHASCFSSCAFSAASASSYSRTTSTQIPILHLNQIAIERFTSRNPPFLNHFHTKSSIMSRRGLTVAGLALAGGAGYYLYSAGGDPKVAQKKMEGRSILDL
jgi:hypothetical protein